MKTTVVKKVIELINVTKRYTIHHEKPTLTEKLISNKKETFIALNSITLKINRGDRVGIIGANGSGKTTLLKVISGITTPTSGRVKRWGKIVSLIDLEAGFHPDLTGYQNIFINGMLLGMSKYEINKKLNAIIQYADIGQFIDAPLYTYSEGMKLRLGFAVAIHTDPDILVFDEALSVGDKQFNKKIYNTLQRLYKKDVTIIIVSHWLAYLKKNCDHIYWLHKGKILSEGGKSVLSRYSAK